MWIDYLPCPTMTEDLVHKETNVKCELAHKLAISHQPQPVFEQRS